MSAEKKQSKSLNKIHRRKNDQIQKQFECTQGCGKAYGSYAALYTHIKNKHPNAKFPQMKQQNIVKNKSGKKGRPQQKQIIQTLKQQSSQREAQCKLCQRSECVCVDDYNEKEKNKTIQIMSNEDFITFINQVGNLLIEDKFTWVRNTEEQFEYLSEEAVQKMIDQFNRKYNAEVRFSTRVIQYLSFSSRYWDKNLIKELYNSLFVMRFKKGKKEILEFFQKEKESFSNMIECANVKKDQFQQICNLIKMI